MDETPTHENTDILFTSGMVNPSRYGLDNGMALTPVLAWSSWYSLNDTNLNETAVHENAEILYKSGMVASGYRFMILDDGWEAPHRDKNGYLHGNQEKFPHGMAALVQHLKPLGLELGLYTTPGNYTCLKNPASWGHIKQDVELWVLDWGITYLKDCECNTTKEMRKTAYADMEAALNKSGIAVTFECDPPYSDIPWLADAKSCNLWAAHDDLEDSFDKWVSAMDDMEEWNLRQYAGPGSWNLPDILRLGEGGQSMIEYRAQMSIYAILAAPLIIGTDLRRASRDIIELYTAPEVLKINQDALGQQGARISSSTGLEVWARNLTGGDVAIGLLNRGLIKSVISASFVDIGLPSDPNIKVQMRDVWARTDIGTYVGGSTIALQTQRHECLLLRASLVH